MDKVILGSQENCALKGSSVVEIKFQENGVEALRKIITLKLSWT